MIIQEICYLVFIILGGMCIYEKYYEIRKNKAECKLHERVAEEVTCRKIEVHYNLKVESGKEG